MHSGCSCYLLVLTCWFSLPECGFKDIKIKILNKMGENRVLMTFTISAFSVLGLLIIFNKSEHERRMELIEEKRALIELQDNAEIRQTQIELDQLIDSIDKRLKK